MGGNGVWLIMQIFEELHSHGIGGHPWLEIYFKNQGIFLLTFINHTVGRWIRECVT